MGSAARGERGFTLLEVLVALVIVAMMATIGLDAFRLSSRAWEHGERRAEAEQRVRVIQGTLSRDLGSLEPVTVVVAGRHVMDFVGQPDRLVFYSSPVSYRPLPYGAMVRRVSYAVARGAGLVVHEAYPLADTAGAARALEPAVTRIAFRYLAPPAPGGKDPQWVRTWEPREVGGADGVALRLQGRTVGDAVSTGYLPLAVEMTLTLEDAGTMRELSLLVPIHVGRYL